MVENDELIWKWCGSVTNAMLISKLLSINIIGVTREMKTHTSLSLNHFILSELLAGVLYLGVESSVHSFSTILSIVNDIILCLLIISSMNILIIQFNS